MQRFSFHSTHCHALAIHLHQRGRPQCHRMIHITPVGCSSISLPCCANNTQVAESTALQQYL